MNQYGSCVDNNFSLVKMILNGVCRKYGELTNNKAGSDDFFENFLLSMMTICIRQGFKEINEDLKLLNKEEFKLRSVKAWVKNLMEIGIKNLVYMAFSPLPWHNHHEI